VVLIPMLY